MAEIKDIIEALATTLSYEFAYGPRPFINYETTKKNLKNGKIAILMLPEVERGIYETERPNPTTSEYSLFIQFARKWETGNTSKSKLDETFDQKYALRLKDLKIAARSFVRRLVCENNFRFISSNSQAEINLYASNIDAINFEFVIRTV